MAQESDEDRIRRKAHQLWESEGRPHGRDQDHWDQAREIIAIEDSQASTLLPRNTGVEEPIEPHQAVDTLGDLPNLTDQGEHPLTDTSREPSSYSSTRPPSSPEPARTMSTAGNSKASASKVDRRTSPVVTGQAASTSKKPRTPKT